MRQFDIQKITKAVPAGRQEKPSPPKESKRKSSLLPYLLGLLLGLVIVFGITQIQGKQTAKEQPVKETKTFEEIEQSETTPSEEPKQEETMPTAPEESQTQPALDKSKVTIQVLNGNGIRGDAYRTKLILEKDGWKVKTYGNASSFKYQSTLVYYKEGQEEAGKAVEETLKKNGKVTSLAKSTSLTKYDVLVIVGKK